MLSFNEYVQSRDPALYQELLQEGMWDDTKNFFQANIKKAAPYAAAAATAAGLGLGATGTYNTVQAALNKPATPKITKLATTQVQTALSPQTITPVDKQYAPDEILIKKVVMPKDLIRAAQTNKEKWDKDFANLNTDYTGDVGHATRKENFDKPSLMYVVKQDAMNRLHPDAGAYANTYNGIKIIVMPDTAFKVLPTVTTNGVPTQWGEEILAHELRHNTQNLDAIPQERYQRYGNKPGSISDQESERGKHYRQDPVEMGVRLAALKNLMSPENINSLANNMRESEKAVIEKMLELSNNDEKVLLTYIMSDALLKKNILDSKAKYSLDNMIRGDSAVYDSEWGSVKDTIKNALNSLREKLGQQNSDAKDLLDYYNKIPLEQRGNFFKELIDNYDKVVQNQSPNQNQNIRSA